MHCSLQRHLDARPTCTVWRERRMGNGILHGIRDARHTPVAAASSGGQDPASIAEALLTQLSDSSTWSDLEPHFGSKLAAQLLQQAQSAMPSTSTVQLPSVQLPASVQLPSVQLPAAPQLPSVQLPNVQLPSVQLPSVHLPSSLPEGQALLEGAASSTANAADRLSHLPGTVQQQLELLQLQLSELASSSHAYEPHFGTRAFMAWLQGAAQTLSSVLHVPMLQLPTGSNTPTHLLLSSGTSNEFSGFGSSSFTSAGSLVNAGPTLDALAASWKAAAVAASHALPEDVSSSISSATAALQASLSAESATAAASLVQLQASLQQLQELVQQLPQRGMGGYDFPTLCFVAAGAIAAVAASVPAQDAQFDGSGDDVRDALTHEYDSQAVAAYFSRRPVLVAQRSLQLAVEVAGFGLSLLGDLWTNRLQVNEHVRAEQLRGVIERLGPAYVKVAQALSTRVDLLSPEYYKQVQLLQDRVPPFPCEQAKEAMSQAFGRPVDDVFSFLSPKPVAAASLGQVYRGRLRPEFGGSEVAVKVQRPDVLEQVCLDLFLMRKAAAAISALPEVKTDWASLIDNWAVRFLHEMDYRREAANGQLFRRQMADAGVSGVVTADVIDELSSDTVLTTAWVDGEKLSESRASDVRELCNTLLSAYLIQLLDTGLLHADPHPGNLIRTNDGKICVLDFGLMTEVTPEQRIALVEYIAHLTTQDWENVARDLQTLGFIPADAGDPVEMGMAEPLGKILVQLSGGGGATKLNIDAVMAELEELGSSYPFSIPPFFALILRAFSVIEGIALAVDPDYAIVQECFPYLARRLLADDDPRVRKALRDVLYGGKQRLDVDRLIRLSDAFSAYTTDGLADQQQQQPQLAAAAAGRSSTPASSSSSSDSSTALSPAAKDALLVVFSKKGSYVQELLVEELVAAADALSREALSETLRALLGSAPVAVAMSSLEALGPLRPLLLPFTTPLELLSRLAPAVALTEEDQEALGVVRGIFQLVQRMQSVDPGSSAGGSYSPVGAADAGNAASGMLFSTTGEGRAAAAGLGGMANGAAIDPRTAVAAAAEVVSDAASVAAELRPLLPDLLPGMAHTGELFVRAFVRRVAVRLADSLTLGGANGSGDAEETAMAMAALGFLAGSGGLKGGLAGVQGGPTTAAGGYSSSANQFGYSAGNGMLGMMQQQQGQQGLARQLSGFGQQQQQVRGFAAGSVGAKGVGASGSSGNGSSAGVQLPGVMGLSAGQLVTGLVAAPLLMMLTPLAVLNEMQRKQQGNR